jgi:hypothetical protein
MGSGPHPTPIPLFCNCIRLNDLKIKENVLHFMSQLPLSITKINFTSMSSKFYNFLPVESCLIRFLQNKIQTFTENGKICHI